LVFSLPSYGLLAGAALLTLFSFRRKTIPASGVCLISSAVFFGYVLLRALFSPVEYLARVDWLMVLGALLVYGLVGFQFTAPKYRLVIVATVLTMVLLHVGLGVFQFLKGESFLPLTFVLPADYGFRARGFYICPSHLAGFLEIAVLLGLSLVVWGRGRLWIKLLCGYAVLIGLAGLLMTGSRGGYLSMFFGLLTFAVLSMAAVCISRRERIWLTFVGGAAVAAMVAIGAFHFISHQYPLQSRAARLLDRGDTRVQLWEAAWQQFHLDPLWGTGSGTYWYYGRKFRSPIVQNDPEYVHNDYLQLLAEFGIVGAVTFLLFLLAHLWSGWRSFRWLVQERAATLGRLRSDGLALTIGSLSAVAAYAIHSIFDFNLHIPANALLLAVVFGILANPGIELPFTSHQVSKLNPWLRLSLPALGLWMALAGLPRLPAEYYGEQARIALRDDQYSASAALAQKAIAYDRTNPYHYLHLGHAQRALADTAPDAESKASRQTAAVAAFRTGLEFFPQDKWLLLSAGSALDAMGHFTEAETYFQTAVFWEPNCAPVRAQYATHLRLAGRLKEAEEQYKKSLALFYNPTAVMGLELLAHESAKPDEP
jgi:O-antigen ligase